MQNLKKGLALAVLGGAAVAVPLLGTGSASAATTPACQVGVTAHTEYKWAPDKVNAGPTQWSLDNPAAGTARTFTWKGTSVAYHRDGTKSTQVTDTTCPAPADVAVQAPQFAVDLQTCSVTIPYTKGIETRLYGVNGNVDSLPITHDTVVSAALDGAPNTAPQFWIGYTAEPGYVLTGAGTGHIDFYNGDDIADCDA
jgi:hypothetical protein